ncbi:hypothetical protein MBEHAL_0058 [Halarchaeum acidiphilum MH1-52-1]|uniref:Uncharacterized protein n=1 Tax=Halarchaeum acidiphilum MH1-52-1 TaxID=1261545 RepID=U3A971_9EURY|nr:hypothetical protein MBEHAL_0058 [Halarchaeum acidiphilum MH1-52-1]
MAGAFPIPVASRREPWSGGYPEFVFAVDVRAVTRRARASG